MMFARDQRMNKTVYDRLVKQFQRDFPGYRLPDDANVIGNRITTSGDDVHVSQQLLNALTQNNPQYQEFKKNNPRLYENPNDQVIAFNNFQKEFLGLNRPAPAGFNSIFGGITRVSNPSNLLSSGEMTTRIFGQQSPGTFMSPRYM
jgi:hypothetical protein